MKSFIKLLIPSLCSFFVFSCDGKTYKIIFANDDGTILEVKELKEGSFPTYSGGDPIKKGDQQYSYTFDDWNPRLSQVSKDVVYTATYIKSINKYTVTFESLGGTIVEPISVEYVKTISKPTDPTRKDFVFEGWFTDTSYATQFNFDTPVIKNLTLFAKWKVDETGTVTEQQWKDAINYFDSDVKNSTYSIVSYKSESMPYIFAPTYVINNDYRRYSYIWSSAEEKSRSTQYGYEDDAYKCYIETLRGDDFDPYDYPYIQTITNLENAYPVYKMDTLEAMLKLNDSYSKFSKNDEGKYVGKNLHIPYMYYESTPYGYVDNAYLIFNDDHLVAECYLNLGYYNGETLLSQQSFYLDFSDYGSTTFTVPEINKAEVSEIVSATELSTKSFEQRFNDEYYFLDLSKFSSYNKEKIKCVVKNGTISSATVYKNGDIVENSVESIANNTLTIRDNVFSSSDKIIVQISLTEQYVNNQVLDVFF